MADLSHVNAVLIVEDDFLIAVDLERVLLDHGCRGARTVGSCGEALELVENGSFDLVTVDVELLDTSCERLVELLRGRGIPFVYVSGFQHGDHPHLPEAPWVSKPIADDELADSLLSVYPVPA